MITVNKCKSLEIYIYKFKIIEESVKRRETKPGMPPLEMTTNLTI